MGCHHRLGRLAWPDRQWDEALGRWQTRDPGWEDEHSWATEWETILLDLSLLLQQTWESIQIPTLLSCCDPAALGDGAWVVGTAPAGMLPVE